MTVRVSDDHRLSRTALVCKQSLTPALRWVGTGLGVTTGTGEPAMADVSDLARSIGEPTKASPTLLVERAAEMQGAPERNGGGDGSAAAGVALLQIDGAVAQPACPEKHTAPKPVPGFHLAARLV